MLTFRGPTPIFVAVSTEFHEDKINPLNLVEEKHFLRAAMIPKSTTVWLYATTNTEESSSEMSHAHVKLVPKAQLSLGETTRYVMACSRLTITSWIRLDESGSSTHPDK